MPEAFNCKKLSMWTGTNHMRVIFRIFLVMFAFEVSTLWFSMMKSVARKEFADVPPTRVVPSSPNMGVLRPLTVLIVADRKSQTDYIGNIASMRCMCQLKNYSLVVTDGVIFEECKNIDNIFFMKPCVARAIMRRHTEVDVLFPVDADTAVINPLPEKNKIENYIVNIVNSTEEKDIVFHMRFHNNEIAADSFIVWNTQWSLDFLRDWYEIAYPPTGPTEAAHPGYSGVNHDNGALHWLLLHRLGSQANLLECSKLGKNIDWGMYASFVACVHRSMSLSGCTEGDWNRIAILPHAQVTPPIVCFASLFRLLTVFHRGGSMMDGLQSTNGRGRHSCTMR